MRNPALLTRVSLAAITIFGVSGTAYAQPAVPAPATPAVEDCAAITDQGERDTCLQNQAVAPAGEQAAAPGEPDAIVVTGSRIRRNAFNTGENITVITREESTQAGFNSTTEALQSSAVTNGSSQINNAFGGFVTDGGPGANTISLRGLGATRTLVLLNGRRISPAGARGAVGSADLNVLPTSIVDRIEILKAGASSIYGSDAIAGVINVVTRNKVTGLTLEGQHNVNEVGAGNSRRYSAVGGYANDRFQISGTVEWYKRDNLRVNDVDFTRCQTDYRRSATNRTPGSADFIDPATGEPKCYPITGTGDNGVTINTIGTNTLAGVGAPGSVGTTFNRFRPNASVTTGLVGFEGVGGGLNNLNVRDTFSPEMLEASLISPATTLTGFLQSSYDTNLLGDGQVYAEVLATRRKSSQVGYRQLSLDYLRGSPLIPTALQGSTFSVAPTETSSGQAVGVRAFIGFGNLDASQEVEFLRTNAGLRGNFFLPEWRYDAFVGKSWSDASYTNNSFLTSRIAQATDVVAVAGGGFACRNPAGGCVAAPTLTAAVIGGDLPQAFRDYIVAEVTGTTKYRESTFAFGVDGPLFALPGGNMQVALGTEYRRASIDDTPPNDSQIGNLYNLTSATPTRGKDSVWEVFGEVELPILRQVPFAYDLTLNGSARYTHYKSYGGGTTYKVAGQYSPVQWLSFRGNYGTSYRAPALFEQFLGATSGFLSQQGDPCNSNGVSGNDVLIANCASEGLAPDFQATSGIRVLTAGGADSGLVAETSKSWSVGGVVQPKFGSFGDLSFAVDYFRIAVENGVSRAGAGNILSLCYNDPEFRSGGGFCRLTSRAAGSNQLTVNNNYVNLSTDIVRGIDFNARYSVPVGPGRLRLSAAVTKFLDQQSRLFEDDPLDDVNGTVNNPKWTGSFDAAYNMKAWNFRYGVEWIAGTSDYTYLGLNEDTTPFLFETPDYFLHNASIQWKGESFGITLGVRNLFDKQPPQISSGRYSRVGNAPLYSGYDYAGRSFFINVSAALDKVGAGLGL